PVPHNRDAVSAPTRVLQRRRPARRARPEDAGDLAVALLEVRDLRTYFKVREGDVRAVDGVSFEVEAGKTLSIVGESGCGKSVTALSIMGLIPKPPARIVSGSIKFDGEELTGLKERELENPRRRELAKLCQS